jgi:hypothetical protein
MMTGREKIEAALSPAGTREVPAVICYEGIYLRDHWEQVTDYPWWYLHAPDLERQLAWRRQEIARTGQDWFDLWLCPSREDREAVGLDVRPEGVFRVDRRTGEETRLEPPRTGGWSPEGGLHSVQAERLPETPEDIDESIPTTPSTDARRVLAEGRDELARRLLEELGNQLYPIRHIATPLWRCYGYWGFEGLMTLVAAQPDLVERACERLLARCVEEVRIAAAVGAAGIWLEECMTDMVGPRAFETLNVRFVRELAEAVRREGMGSIYYFCGNPAGKWDLLFSVGADAVSLEESKKGFVIDIEEVVARAAGRCAVLGNLDAIHLLPAASEEMLRAEIARQIAAGRRNGSRFLMSLGSPVTPGTPVERVRRYCELVREMGGDQSVMRNRQSASTQKSLE